MKAFLTLLIAVLFIQAPLTAQNEPTKAETDLLARWDFLAKELKQVKSRLSSLQIQYSGNENAAERDALEKKYNGMCSEFIEAVKAHLVKVAAFLKDNPDNFAVRDRRATDTVFLWMDRQMRAQDCKILYEQTKRPHYLELAAEHLEKGYQFEACAEARGLAVAAQPTVDNFYAHGTSLMNASKFKEAQEAFLAGLPYASEDKDKKKLNVAAEFAAAYVKDWPREMKLRDESRLKNNLPIVEIVTDRGTMTLELFEDQAPNTVANFIVLAEKHFYDNGKFHRCIENFMIQGGDPTSTGGGGPGYKIKDECNTDNDFRLHYHGSISMAKPAGQPDSGGSQFFITSGVAGPLNGRHTVFGRVLKGIEITHVKGIDVSKNGLPFKILSVNVLKKRDHPYKVEKIDG